MRICGNVALCFLEQFTHKENSNICHHGKSWCSAKETFRMPSESLPVLPVVLAKQHGCLGESRVSPTVKVFNAPKPAEHVSVDQLVSSSDCPETDASMSLVCQPPQWSLLHTIAEETTSKEIVCLCQHTQSEHPALPFWQWKVC